MGTRLVRGGMVLAGALLLSFGTPSPATAAHACAHATAEPTGRNSKQLRTAVLCLLNAERAERGLKALKADRKLLKAARRHSDDMIRRGYFDHVSPDGKSMRDRVVAARYVSERGSWRVAENIAWGAGAYGSPTNILASWMHSAPHRRNILDRSLRHAGVGVAAAAPHGGEGATFTLVLGRR